MRKAIPLLLILAILAGCVDDQPVMEPLSLPDTGYDASLTWNVPGGSALLIVDGPDAQDLLFVTDLAGDFGSESLLEEEGLEHPGAFTAFDQLLQHEGKDGLNLSYAFSSFGFYLTGLAGIEGESTQTEVTYWALYRNGNFAELGMDAQVLQEGDIIVWAFESYELEWNVAWNAVGATENATVALNLTGPEDLFVSVSAHHQDTATVVYEGALQGAPSTFDLPGYGETVLQLLYDRDGTQVQENQTAVLLAPFTFIVDPAQGSPVTNSFLLNVDDLAAAPLYGECIENRPPTLNLHDVFEAWMRDTEGSYATDGNDCGDFGPFLEQVNGQSHPEDWCVEIDGEATDFGLRDQLITREPHELRVAGCVGVLNL